MKYKIVILIIFSFFLINAQGGWKRTYAIPNSGLNLPWGVFESSNGNFIETGLILDTLANPPEYKLTVLNTDSQGNLLWVKSTGGGKFTYLDCFTNKSFINDLNSFYVVTTVADTTNRQIGMLIKFDMNGDTLWRKVYGDQDPQEDVVVLAFTKSVDGGFLLTGFFQHWGNNTNTCLVIKTDSNGNELWRKKINKVYPDVQAGYSIIQDTVTKKIIIVGYQYMMYSSNIGTYSNILILDQFGNKLAQTTMNNFDGGPFSEIIQLKDKNFLVCGSENANNDQASYPRYISVLVKFDISGNMIWKRKYDTLSLYNRIDNLHELDNGDIFICGILDTLRNYNIIDIVKLKVLRTDSDGNIKWRKYIGSSYSHENSEGATSMRPTINGGFVFATRFPNSTNPKSFSIIKIDSAGCDTLESYCKRIISGVNDFSNTFGYNTEIFPNPTKNVVNIRVNAPVDKSFVVQITDVSGKKVNSYLANPNESIAINTITFESGIYFITVYHENKRVAMRKLVVVH